MQGFTSAALFADFIEEFNSELISSIEQSARGFFFWPVFDVCQIFLRKYANQMQLEKLHIWHSGFIFFMGVSLLQMVYIIFSHRKSKSVD